MTTKQRTPAEIVSRNLKMLLDDRDWKPADLSRRSGVGARTVAYALDGERNSGILTLERMALPFRLRGWELLIPHESVETLKSGAMAEIAINFLRSSPEGREHIQMVAAREATFTRR